MPEYIERDMFLKIISRKPSFPTTDREDRLINYCISAVKNFPAADARPVVRGKWIKPTRVPNSMLSECSVCGFDTGAYTFNFCPNCGADMRKEEKS